MLAEERREPLLVLLGPRGEDEVPNLLDVDGDGIGADERRAPRVVDGTPCILDARLRQECLHTVEEAPDVAVGLESDDVSSA